MTMTRKKYDYVAMKQELQTILTEMQTGTLDVESAITKYERGQVLIADLEAYLQSAENKIILGKKEDENQ